MTADTFRRFRAAYSSHLEGKSHTFMVFAFLAKIHHVKWYWIDLDLDTKGGGKYTILSADNPECKNLVWQPMPKFLVDLVWKDDETTSCLTMRQAWLERIPEDQRDDACYEYAGGA